MASSPFALSLAINSNDERYYNKKNAVYDNNPDYKVPLKNPYGLITESIKQHQYEYFNRVNNPNCIVKKNTSTPNTPRIPTPPGSRHGSRSNSPSATRLRHSVVNISQSASSRIQNMRSIDNQNTNLVKQELLISAAQILYNAFKLGNKSRDLNLDGLEDILLELPDINGITYIYEDGVPLGLFFSPVEADKRKRYTFREGGS